MIYPDSRSDQKRKRISDEDLAEFLNKVCGYLIILFVYVLLLKKNYVCVYFFIYVCVWWGGGGGGGILGRAAMKLSPPTFNFVYKVKGGQHHFSRNLNFFL